MMEHLPDHSVAGGRGLTCGLSLVLVLLFALLLLVLLHHCCCTEQQGPRPPGLVARPLRPSSCP